MTKLTCLDCKYSTTRLVAPEEPALHRDSEDMFETKFFLLEGEGRQGVGGLRTQGYFKQSQPNKPVISVVTVVFNGEKFLEDTIQSVINQTYDNVEYIIIDGGSTDGTLDIIKKYVNQIDYWVSEKDEGIYDAWNKAVSVLSGVWVSFLGADDTYKPTALSLYADMIAVSPEINYISSRVDLMKSGKRVRVVGEAFSAVSFKKRMNVAHVGSLHKRELFLKTGLFNLNYKVVSDYEFFVRNLSKIRAGFINESCANMQVGGVSDGSTLVFQEVAKVKLKYGLRTKYSAWLEKNYSIFKWLLRKKIWY